MKLRVRPAVRIWLSLGLRFVIVAGATVTGAMSQGGKLEWPDPIVYPYALFLGIIGAATALELYIEEADDDTKSAKPAK
jgi:hypothetical protein